MVAKKKDAYLWYSVATDVTGKKLAEALKIEHGKEVPKGNPLVIGWGTKIAKDVVLPKVSKVLNHPNNIRKNRNKLISMDLMTDAGVNIAKYVTTENAKNIRIAGGDKTENVTLPVIGRTKFHQGGKGFWTCPTMTHVKAAIDDGAQYFQNLIEIDSEFRLHIFNDKLIHAVKKVKRTKEEMEIAYIKHEMERQKVLAEKNGDKLDEDTIMIFLKRQARKFAQDGANMLIRSNHLGWKFVVVKKPNAKLVEEAIKALGALKLTFGAVDGCIDVNGDAWIFEVNTGPGLEQTPFEAYVTAFSDKIKAIYAPKEEEKIIAIPKEEHPNVKIPKNVIGKAEDKATALMNKLMLATEMVKSADPDDIETLNKVFKKIFG